MFFILRLTKSVSNSRRVEASAIGMLSEALAQSNHKSKLKHTTSEVGGGGGGGGGGGV
jgi:hypothetical protein